MSKKLTITISPEGKVTVDVEGFVGQSCEEVTRFLQEQAQVVDKTRKPEYWQTPMSWQMENE